MIGALVDIHSERRRLLLRLPRMASELGVNYAALSKSCPKPEPPK
jgi:hypothetical protein